MSWTGLGSCRQAGSSWCPGHSRSSPPTTGCFPAAEQEAGRQADRQAVACLIAYCLIPPRSSDSTRPTMPVHIVYRYLGGRGRGRGEEGEGLGGGKGGHGGGRGGGRRGVGLGGGGLCFGEYVGCTLVRCGGGMHRSVCGLYGLVCRWMGVGGGEGGMRRWLGVRLVGAWALTVWFESRLWPESQPRLLGCLLGRHCCESHSRS